MDNQDKDGSSIEREVADAGELVYLKCSCCDLLVEHHCKADKAKIPDDATMETAPVRGRKGSRGGKRRQSKKGRGGGVRGAKRAKTTSNDAALLASTSDFVGGDLSNGSSRVLGSGGNKVHKTAEDYLRQLASDDLKITDDGLDIFCVKCEKLLSKVAMGQRVRIDNLFSHVNSWAHKKMGTIEATETSEKHKKSEDNDDVPSSMANGNNDEHEDDSMGDAPETVAVTTPSSRKKKRDSNAGPRQKTAQEYVDQLQCPDIEVAIDGMNIQCLACDRLITKVDKGQRIRVDNISTHIKSTAHKTLADIRNAGEVAREHSIDSDASSTRVVQPVQTGEGDDSDILANTGLVPTQGGPSTRGSSNGGLSSLKRSKRKMGIPAKSEA